MTPKFDTGTVGTGIDGAVAVGTDIDGAVAVGLVGATTEGGAGPQVIDCPVFTCPDVAGSGGDHEKSLPRHPDPVRCKEEPTDVVPCSATPMSKEDIPCAGPSKAVKVPS